MEFDAVIIGTGMGGATTGYALAKSGLRVLFIEKGLSRLSGNKMLEGAIAETKFNKSNSKQDILKHAGRVNYMIRDNSRLISNSFTPFIGEGGGGSSAVYGAILERFKTADFVGKDNIGALKLSKWPISYDEMDPYYTLAEKLYHVSVVSEKEIDTLSQANKKLWHQLKLNGLHPYILPAASDNTIGCIDNCQSYLCDKGCKNDSEKICLKPAIEQYSAKLWDGCEVLKIEEQNGHIQKVICLQNKKIIEVTADVFVLAAGALATPNLLFRSSNSKWLNGLANSSGLVGRYLMRHYIDLFAVELPGVPIIGRSQKQIGFNDFYQLPEGKFGTVQSFGLMPPIESVLAELSEISFGGSFLKSLLNLFHPFTASIYKKQFANKLIFASIMEDSPDNNNRIQLENNTLSLRYKIPDCDSKKIKQFRKMVAKAFDPFKVNIMKQSNNNKRIAHACGTCRFGEDPRLSVLNQYNQTHDIANLYITDASFFPTSGGINPSLTIAANALRVAEYITAK